MHMLLFDLKARDQDERYTCQKLVITDDDLLKKFTGLNTITTNFTSMSRKLKEELLKLLIVENVSFKQFRLWLLDVKATEIKWKKYLSKIVINWPRFI